MSINDINNAAAAMNQLKLRYEGFLDDADDQIGTRQAAYDALANDLEGVVRGLASQVLFVDPVNGSDENDGQLSQSALASLPEAYSRALPGGHLEVRIVGNSVDASFEGTVTCDSRRLKLITTEGGTDTSNFPTIRSGQTRMVFGNLEIQGVNLDSSVISLFRFFGHANVKTLRCDITLGEYVVFTHHSSEPSHLSLNMAHTHLTEAAGVTSPKLMLASTWDFTGTSVSVPAGKSWSDYLYVVSAADGVPLNGLSNITI